MGTTALDTLRGLITAWPEIRDECCIITHDKAFIYFHSYKLNYIDISRWCFPRSFLYCPAGGGREGIDKEQLCHG